MGVEQWGEKSTVEAACVLIVVALAWEGAACACVWGVVGGDRGRREEMAMHVMSRKCPRFPALLECLTPPHHAHPPQPQVQRTRGLVVGASKGWRRRACCSNRSQPPSPAPIVVVIGIAHKSFLRLTTAQASFTPKQAPWRAALWRLSRSASTGTGYGQVRFPPCRRARAITLAPFSLPRPRAAASPRTHIRSPLCPHLTGTYMLAWWEQILFSKWHVCLSWLSPHPMLSPFIRKHSPTRSLFVIDLLSPLHYAPSYSHCFSTLPSLSTLPPLSQTCSSSLSRRPSSTIPSRPPDQSSNMSRTS